jgi:predicted transcriptional regulator
MRTATRVIGARRVRDLMQPQVISVVPEMTVRELAQTLLDEGVSGAPVLGPTGKILGVVAMTEVVRLAAQEAGRSFDERRVRDVMTPVAFSVRPDDSILELIRFFLRRRVHRALVVERDTLLGIVTPFDLLHLLEQELV